MADQEKQETPQPSVYGLTPEEEKMRARRNLALALSLALFIIVVFAVTVLRLGGQATG